METIIELQPSDNLESTVYTLLAAKARKEHVYCVFNGHVFHSDTITMDSAFKEVIGITKTEYDQRKKLEEEMEEREEKARKFREVGYAEKVTITKEAVVNGLKFIAEHPSITHDELVNGLLQLGCNFTFEDIKEQYPQPGNLAEGMKEGHLASGASVIANVRDFESGLGAAQWFLNSDNENSIYHFIRVSTGDETYTKEYVDSLNNQNSITK